MGNGLSEGALGLAALSVDVNPLMVERSVGKHIDAFLVDVDIVRRTYFLAEEFLEILVAIDDDLTHIVAYFLNSAAKVLLFVQFCGIFAAFLRENL